MNSAGGGLNYGCEPENGHSTNELYYVTRDTRSIRIRVCARSRSGSKTVLYRDSMPSRRDHPSRRGLLGGVAIAGTLLLLASAWWWLWVPNNRPALAGSEVHAIDVSSHQGEIDWDAVANDGIGAAMIKATEGKGFIDPRFAQNWDAAADAGLRRGAYHFFTLCASGSEQADNFLATAPPDEFALAPAVDLELIGPCTDRPPQSEVDIELETFRRAVEAAWGRPLLVYARASFTSKYSIGALADNPSWVTHFFLRPTNDEWTMWQVHYVARVDGIEGDVDLDVLRLTPPS